MRGDFVVLVPALAIAVYQIRLWKKLSDNNVAIINGKYRMKHYFAFVLVKYSTYFLFMFQFFFHLFRITEKNHNYLYIFGYLLVIIGLVLSTTAVKELKNNWDSMMLYKIIPNHKLIKTGIYKYIRHPIYSAVILEVVGYELIANSWLFICFLVASTLVFNIHIKNEEELLIKHFGREYTDYKKQTKRYIPFFY